jgi:hypothetical protein
VVSLNPDWTDYSIPLNDLNLDSVIGGFGWIIDTKQGGKQSTMYIKDINYN